MSVLTDCVVQVQTYGRMWLCGPYLPNSFLVQRSKYKKLTFRFKSNASVTRLGFRAVVEATGTSRAADAKDGRPLENSPYVSFQQNTTNSTEGSSISLKAESSS